MGSQSARAIALYRARWGRAGDHKGRPYAHASSVGREASLDTLAVIDPTPGAVDYTLPVASCGAVATPRRRSRR